MKTQLDNLWQKFNVCNYCFNYSDQNLIKVHLKNQMKKLK